MPYLRQAEVVLARWREVMRELESTEQGSAEALFLQVTAARLRSEYEQLVEDVHGHGQRDSPSVAE